MAAPENLFDPDAFALEPPTLTKEEIEAAAISHAYTRKQLTAWGVPWPPPKGWKERLLRGERP